MFMWNFSNAQVYDMVAIEKTDFYAEEEPFWEKVKIDAVLDTDKMRLVIGDEVDLSIEKILSRQRHGKEQSLWYQVTWCDAPCYLELRSLEDKIFVSLFVLFYSDSIPDGKVIRTVSYVLAERDSNEGSR